MNTYSSVYLRVCVDGMGTVLQDSPVQELGEDGGYSPALLDIFAKQTMLLSSLFGQENQLFDHPFQSQHTS